MIVIRTCLEYRDGALALQADRWLLRADIVWHKPNPIPSGSARDRPTRAHEFLFLLSKSHRYYYDGDSIRVPHTSGTKPRKRSSVFSKAQHVGNHGQGCELIVPNPLGKNRRNVWTVAVGNRRKSYKHFAMFPPDLVMPCILAGCPFGGTVLDPFSGSGTTGFVALQLGREYIGFDLNPEYTEIAQKRLAKVTTGRKAMSVCVI